MTKSNRRPSGYEPDELTSALIAPLRGAPTAPSSTVTLLRLHPGYQSRFERGTPFGTPVSNGTSFHGVTGGVYKARERIHRRMADRRLLAIPTSRGRVAAHDLNLGRVWGSVFPFGSLPAVSVIVARV